MLANLCLVANCPSFNDNKPYHPLCHSPWPRTSLSDRNNKQEFPFACLSTSFGTRALCCPLSDELAQFASSKTCRAGRSEYLGRENHSVPPPHQERRGFAHGLEDLSRPSKMLFGAPSCGCSHPHLPTQLSSATAATVVRSLGAPA